MRKQAEAKLDMVELKQAILSQHSSSFILLSWQENGVNLRSEITKERPLGRNGKCKGGGGGACGYILVLW